MTQLAEFARSLLARLRDEAVNVIVWIGKVAVLLIVFNWIVRRCFDSSDSAGRVIAQMLYDNDLNLALGGVALLFVFAVALFTITHK